MTRGKDPDISTHGDRDLVIRRSFAAPRELVFDAWTKPELLVRWHGARDWLMLVCEIDLRVGGTFRFVSRRSDGRKVGQHGVYRAMSRPDRIVHTESWEGWNPGESLVTIDFTAEGTFTRVTQTMQFPSKEVRDTLMRAGLADNTGESFARLDDVVAAPRGDLVVRRRYPVPVSVVWNAWTESEAVKRWWGPRGFSAPVAQMDVREGGTSLVCMRAPNGQDMFSTWAYDRVVPRELLEYFFDLSDSEGHPIEPAQLGLPADFPRHVRHVVTFAAVDQATELTVIERGYRSDAHFDLSKQGLEQCLDKMGELFGEHAPSGTSLSSGVMRLT